MAHTAVRQMWAQAMIVPQPGGARDWQHGLPSDVLAAALTHLLGDPRTLGAARASCAPWRAAVDGCVRELTLRSWPQQPRAVARFRGLESLALKGPYVPYGQGGLDLLGPLLSSMATLPRLRALEMPYPGPGPLDRLDCVSQLTSLALVRSHDAGADPGIPRPASSPAAVTAPPVIVLPAGHGLPHGFGLTSDAASGGASMDRDFPALPGALARLPRLHTLRLDNLPPSYDVLRDLSSLQRLEMRGQTLRVRSGLLVAANPLPGVEVLVGLTALVARCNYGINGLPVELGKLSALEHLDVSKNMLWQIPSEIAQLSSLRHLDVSSNCLTALPDDLPESLTHLDASNNSRVALPETLSRLGSLQSLHLNWVWSDLRPLFTASAGLTSLVTLRAIGNGITDLPPEIGGFKGLKVLELAMNNLSTLPATIGQLSDLTHLDLSDNRLTALPLEISGLSSLESLALRSNSLSTVCEELGALTALSCLDLSMNHLEHLPEGITSLRSLQTLAVSMNPLVSLPPGISALAQLRVLEMYYVRLSEGEEAAAGHLQQLIPGLFVFSNTGAPAVPGAAARSPATLPMGSADFGGGVYPPSAAAGPAVGVDPRGMFSVPAAPGAPEPGAPRFGFEGAMVGGIPNGAGGDAGGASGSGSGAARYAATVVSTPSPSAGGSGIGGASSGGTSTASPGAAAEAASSSSSASSSPAAASAPGPGASMEVDDAAAAGPASDAADELQGLFLGMSLGDDTGAGSSNGSRASLAGRKRAAGGSSGGGAASAAAGEPPANGGGESSDDDAARRPCDQGPMGHTEYRRPDRRKTWFD